MKMSEADKIIESLKNSGKKVEEFYVSNKTSDKNVVTEEDLEVLNEVLLHNRETEQARIAIEHMLAEREQKDKRIQELEAKLEFKKFEDLDNVEFKKYMNQFIPKQVVIDEINKYNEKIEKYNEYREQGKETDVEYYENITNTAIVQVLTKILGGEK